jgi:beta-N-acetylhexosaminidase
MAVANIPTGSTRPHYRASFEALSRLHDERCYSKANLDTSSYVTPCLAQALRRYYPYVDEFLVAQTPVAGEIARLRERIRDYDLLVLVTLSASLQPAQALLARALLALGLPTVTVAARTPYDLTVYPEARTHLCIYSIQPPSMDALAAALWGEIPMTGRLPVQLPRH